MLQHRRIGHRLVLVAWIAALAISPGAARANPEDGYELRAVASWPGPARQLASAIAISGKRAVLAGGDRIGWLDLTDPARPKLRQGEGRHCKGGIGRILWEADHLVCLGCYCADVMHMPVPCSWVRHCFATGPDGILRLEDWSHIPLQQPDALHIQGGIVYHVDAQSDSAYSGTVPFLSITALDDLSKSRVATNLTFEPYSTVSLRGQSNRLYVLVRQTSKQAVHILDLENPWEPRPLGQWSIPVQTAVCQMEISGTWVVLWGFAQDLDDEPVSDESQTERILVLDASIPAEARLLGAVEFPFGHALWQVQHDHAFLAKGSQIDVISWRDGPPRVSGAFTAEQPIGAFAVQEDLMVTSDEHGVRVYSVVTPEAPELLGQLPLVGHAMDVATDGNRLWLADGPGGLRLLSAEDPTHPTEITSWKPPGDVVHVARLGDRILAASSRGEKTPEPTGELAILRLENGTNLVAEAVVRFPGAVVDMALSGTKVAVAYQPDGLLNHLQGLVGVYDFTQPESPREVATYTAGGPVTGIAFAEVGDIYVGVATGSAAPYGGSLEEVSIDAAGTATRTSDLPLPGAPRSIRPWGSILYMICAGQPAGIAVAQTDRLIYYRDLGYYREGTLEFAGHQVLAALWFGFLNPNGTLESYSTSWSYNLELARSATIPEHAYGLAWDGHRMWLAAGAAGLMGYRWIETPTFVLARPDAAGRLHLGWKGDPETRLQWKPTLESREWQTLEETLGTTNRVVPMSASRGFFRLVIP